VIGIGVEERKCVALCDLGVCN